MRSEAAERVRSARIRAGLSQRELAQRSGVRQPNIAAIESGRSQPTADTVDKLLAAAAVRPSVVLAERRDEVRRAIARAGGRNPRVFGSVALNSDTPSSDVDLLVDLGDEPSIWQVAALVEELRALLGTDVDLVDDHGSGRVLDRARSEAVPL